MAEAPAFGGVMVDHLYESCPALVRSVAAVERDGWPYEVVRPGARLLGSVDPEGTDLCGWCQRVWKARHS